MKKAGLAFVAVFLLLALSLVITAEEPKQPLIGVWHVRGVRTRHNRLWHGLGLTNLNWTITFKPDATWTVKNNWGSTSNDPIDGTYKTDGEQLKMKRSTEELYYEGGFKVEQGGKILMLATEDRVIDAERQ